MSRKKLPEIIVHFPKLFLQRFLGGGDHPSFPMLLPAIYRFPPFGVFRSSKGEMGLMLVVCQDVNRHEITYISSKVVLKVEYILRTGLL